MKFQVNVISVWPETPPVSKGFDKLVDADEFLRSVKENVDWVTITSTEREGIYGESGRMLDGTAEFQKDLPSPW